MKSKRSQLAENGKMDLLGVPTLHTFMQHMVSEI
jgi:hypothetical protein